MEFFYEVAILDSPLSPLTYKSDIKVDIFSKVIVDLRNREVGAIVLKEVIKPNFECKELKDSGYKLDNRAFEIAKFISNYYVCSIGEAFGLFYFYKDRLNLEKICLLNFNIELSAPQKEALEFIKSHKTSLIFGDTASGKTELFFYYVKEVIENSQSSIILMPEISLTPQMEERLRIHFGDLVAIWHSKVKPKQKEQILKDINSGKVRVVAGARSALFLPMQNLALVVVDEEHDDAYKSSLKPRINAKDLSIFISDKFDIKTVLISATPSLNSYHKIPHFRLEGSFFKTSKNIIFENSQPKLSIKIINHIEHALLNKKQIIIFIPVRGNFKYISCIDCKKVLECPNCSISLTLHKNDKIAKCHYCGYFQNISKKCPNCESENGFSSDKFGTAELVSALEELLDKNVVIKKFDRDEITTQNKLEKVLNDFNNHKIDILVGTQMLSKGHNYHNVALSIIMGIDYIYFMPDFRAKERAMALVTQVAGRSGRKGSGEVIIQTTNLDFFKSYIGKYDKFIEDELNERKALNYPPFSRFARAIFSSNSIQKCEIEMEKALEIIKNFDVEIVGYGEASISKILNRYRFQILLKSNKINPLLKALHSIRELNCDIDIDPINFG